MKDNLLEILVFTILVFITSQLLTVTISETNTGRIMFSVSKPGKKGGKVEETVSEHETVHRDVFGRL